MTIGLLRRLKAEAENLRDIRVKLVNSFDASSRTDPDQYAKGYIATKKHNKDVVVPALLSLTSKGQDTNQQCYRNCHQRDPREDVVAGLLGARQCDGQTQRSCPYDDRCQATNERDDQQPPVFGTPLSRLIPGVLVRVGHDGESSAKRPGPLPQP